MRAKYPVVCVMLLAVGGMTWAQDKPIITVLDFQVDQVSEAEMKTLISLLSSALFQTQRYTVIDVSERDRLLKEIEFSVSDCSDEGCQVEIGKLLSAEFVVSGRLGKIGARYVVSTKMLETSSSRTVSTADGTYSKLEDVIDDLPVIAAKLAGVAAPAEAGVAAEKPATESEPEAEPEKESRPPREPIVIHPLRIAGIGCAGGAVACGVVGGILLAGGVEHLQGPVTDAFDAYMAEPQGSSTYDTLYDAYLAEFQAYRGKMGPAVALVAGGVLLAGASVVFFVLPVDPAGESTAAAISVVPSLRGVGLRVSW